MKFLLQIQKFSNIFICFQFLQMIYSNHYSFQILLGCWRQPIKSNIQVYSIYNFQKEDHMSADSCRTTIHNFQQNVRCIYYHFKQRRNCDQVNVPRRNYLLMITNEFDNFKFGSTQFSNYGTPVFLSLWKICIPDYIYIYIELRQTYKTRSMGTLYVG